MLCIFVVMLLSSTQLFSETAMLPPSLEKWEAWVLDGKDVSSPHDWKGSQGSQQKVWLSELKLSSEQKGMTFSMRAEIYHPDWVMLPGEESLWPSQVTVNGSSTAVVLREGRPMIYAEAGACHIKGYLPWRKAPSSLALPQDVGLVTLWSEGQRVRDVHMDRNGRLWLKVKQDVVKGEADSLNIQVYRKLIDLEPMRLDTLIQLSVTGKEREVSMGPAQLSGFELMKFDHPLPARVEKNGRLRVKVKSGQYTFRLTSRAVAQLSELQLENGTAGWPKEEVWSIAEQRHLRSIEIQGGVSINPQNHDMPQDWKTLPAYLMSSGETMTLVETSRGDLEPKANRLSITRDIWLDFDGQGATVKDSIQGKLHQGWRLDAQDDLVLGSAKVSGKPTLVTMLNGARGIELRNSQIDVNAVSRMEENVSSFFASGWNHSMEKASIRLHLPPAHDLIYAKGVDSARGSWFEKWSLLDVFVVLLISFAWLKICGPWFGFASALYLVLAYHSPFAPRFLLFHFVVALSLLKVLPKGKWRKTTMTWAWIAMLFLILASLRFAGFQIREVIYPQLELNDSGYGVVFHGQRHVEMEPQVQEMTAKTYRSRAMSLSDLAISSAGAPRRSVRKLKRDMSNLVQTGPGLPKWSGSVVNLSWSGPLSETEPLELVLLRPWAWKLIRVLRVLLLACVIVGILRQMVGRMTAVTPSLAVPSVALWLPLLMLGLHQHAFSESFPSTALLQELEHRLTRLPETASSPFGVSSAEGWIEDGHLTLRFDIEVLNTCYLPINGRLGSWMPEQVLVGGNVAKALRKNKEGVLQCVVEKGRQTLVLSGPLKDDFVKCTMPFPVHHFDMKAPGWLVTGLVNGRVPSGSLQLDKIEENKSSDGKKKDVLLPDPITPFVEIQRRLKLGNDWTLTTTIRRVAPEQEPLYVHIPIVECEKILTEHVQLKDKQVLIQLGRGRTSASWTSRLEPMSELVFERGSDSEHQETWEIDASSLWRVEFEGLQQEKRDDGRFIFYPRKGELLRLLCSSPKAASGLLTTVDNVSLQVRAGQRLQRSDLNLHLNSSIAATETFTLPTGSVLEKVEVNGQAFSLRMEDHTLSLPLSPGEQNVKISWSAPKVLGVVWRSPELMFSHTLNNISTTLKLPSDRWILACGGPVKGPAVLFWGFLVSTWLAFLCLPWLAKRLSFQLPLGTFSWSLLLLGFCTVHPLINILFVGWFFLMGWRRRQPDVSMRLFKFRQLCCVMMTFAVLMSMLGAIPFSLLGSPNMMIEGNGSSSMALKWFQDRSSGSMPLTWTFSLPLWVYRVSMLVWSLWLASSLVKWLKWAWECFSEGGCWKKKTKVLESESDLEIDLD